MSDGVLALSDLTSRGVHPRVRAAARLDPYWDGLWKSGALASWVSSESVKRQAESGLGRIPAHLDIDPDEAFESFTSAWVWRRKLEVLGMVNAWRTMTDQQLAALVGAPSLAGRSGLLDTAFAAGLLDHGSFVGSMGQAHPASHTRLLRPSALDTYTRRLLPLLTYPEQVMVTGGRRLRVGGQYDRHNLLTTELALRVAEFCDVGAVMGETYASLDLLLGTGLGREEIKGNPAADAAFIRPDGMRVAIELTASITGHFKDKVRRWAQHMSKASMSLSGLTVLFIGAPPPDRYPPAERNAFASQMTKMIREVVDEYPGVPGTRHADRIGMAMWHDYFPARGKVTTDFLSLTARIPSGAKGKPWDRKGMLDEFDIPFTPMDPQRTEASHTGAATVISSPVWLRRAGQPYQFHNYAMNVAGFDTAPIPQPDPRHREGFDPHVHRGPGALAKPPARLTITTLRDEGG
ncbi:hypothetical protein [Pseudactinotalea sp. Z1748]|uniref:hypothetical protein n=1 Tax=Pseudactinotalea sp. Z1748 TaxID=3413027 RepID=UPI003C79D18A